MWIISETISKNKFTPLADDIILLVAIYIHSLNVLEEEENGEKTEQTHIY